MATDVRSIAAALGVLALAAPARADQVRPDTAPGNTDPTPAPPPSRRLQRWQLAVHLGLRGTALDGHAAGFRADARNYGWQGARAAALYGGAVEVSYLWTPIIDVGVAVTRLKGTFATSVDQASLDVGVTSVGATARLHWAGGHAFVPEPRVDAGVVAERISLRGERESRYLPYLRAGIDWRLGTDVAGVDLAIGYTMADHDQASPVSPPIGGLDLAAGPYFRF